MIETIASLRSRYREAARAKDIDPRDIDVLLADATGRSQSWLFAHGEEAIDPSSFDRLVARRLHGEPLQYIRGRAEFFGREFYVDDRVLIPRPDTEHLVETTIARAPGGGRLLEVGAGSGCIAISIERQRPDLEVVSVDISLAALA